MRPVPLPGPLVAAGMTGLSSPRVPASRSSSAGDPAVDRRLPLRLLDSSARPRTQPRAPASRSSSAGDPAVDRRLPLRFLDSPAPEPALVMSPALRSSGTGHSRGPPAARPASLSPAPDLVAGRRLPARLLDPQHRIQLRTYINTIGEW